MLRSEHPTQALYLGLAPNLRRRGPPRRGWRAAAVPLYYFVAAGLVATAAANPARVLKTRMLSSEKSARGLRAGRELCGRGPQRGTVCRLLKRCWLRYAAGDPGDAADQCRGEAGCWDGNESIRSRLQTYNAEETFGKGIQGLVWREEGWREL